METKPEVKSYRTLVFAVFLNNGPGVDGGAEPSHGSFQDPSGASRVTALCETENPKSHMGPGASSSGGEDWECQPSNNGFHDVNELPAT